MAERNRRIKRDSGEAEDRVVVIAFHDARTSDATEKAVGSTRFTMSS